LPGPPLPTATAGPPLPSEAAGPGHTSGPSELEKYNQDCEERAQEWRAAQVDYPTILTVPLHESVTYKAVVDVRKEPLPADRVIIVEKGTAGSASIFVQCRIAARLIAVGDGLTVSNDPAVGPDGWIYQPFTPLELVEWSWSFKADKPKVQELRMELRPATLADGSTSPLDPSGNQLSFVTRVVVEASPIQIVAYWFETQWPLLAGTAITLGLAVLALKNWIGELIGKSRKKRKKKKKLQSA
jgi:hypothetical protein